MTRIMERKATYYLSSAVIGLALVAMLLAAACGLATQSSGIESTGHPVAQEQPTPEPTPTPPTFVKYPNLDEVLVGVVDKYESGELTEREAAKQAPQYHGETVLVEVDTLEAQIDPLDTWMGEQGIEPRFKDPEYFRTPHIYAYVRVSVLGTLSNQEGVTAVWHVEDMGETPVPEGILGQEGASDPPNLPYWLKGSEYSRLRSPLNSLIYDYENGTITAQEVLNDEFIHITEGDTIYVTAQVRDLSKVKAVNEWLKAQYGVFQVYMDGHLVSGYVPVPSILALSRRPGVFEVYTYDDPRNRAATNNEPVIVPQDSEQSDQRQPRPTVTPTPTPVVSQGLFRHGINAWNGPQAATKYKGNGVKVGIIERGSSIGPISRILATCPKSPM